MTQQKLRVAAIADIHYGKHSRGTLHDTFAACSQRADVLLLCGDLTDYGLAEEAEELIVDLRSAVHIPILAVLGNHDFESGQPELVRKVLEQAGITANRNAIPFDTSSPFKPGGIRVGTPAVTTRGMKEEEMLEIADLVAEALEKRSDAGALENVRKKVLDLTRRFPLPI